MTARLAALAVALLAALLLPPAAGAQAPGTTSFDGRVGSVDRAARSFRLRDAERGTVRIRMRSSTRFERVDGVSGVRPGIVIEVRARRSGGAWIAVEVERSGRDGGGGGGRGRGRGEDD